MTVFPSLSVGPSFPVEEQIEDATLRSPTEGGYVITRARFTRLRRSWTLKYRHMSQADRDALVQFVREVGGGADAFSWTVPDTGEQVQVRFLRLPRFENIAAGLYSCEFQLEEV